MLCVTLAVDSSYSSDLLEAFHSALTLWLCFTHIPAEELIALNQVYNTIARVTLATCLHTVLA